MKGLEKWRGLNFLFPKRGLKKSLKRGSLKIHGHFCIFEGEIQNFCMLHTLFHLNIFFARLQNIIFGYAHTSSVPECLPKIDCL